MGTFYEATAVTARGEIFDAELDAQWSVGTKPHGGYLLAVLCRAARQATGVEHPYPTAVSGSFIEAPEPGKAEITVEPLRRGRGATQVRARLTQGGTPRVEAMITMGRLEETDAWWTSLDPVELPAEADCFLTPTEPPGAGFTVPLMEVIEQRINPDHLGFAFGSPSKRGIIAGWHRLADGSDWDPLSLLVALDPVPPVSYDLGAPGWAPTIQLSAYLRRLPAAGPVRVRMFAGDVSAEHMDETAHVWDSKGRLVAQATQIAAIRLPT